MAQFEEVKEVLDELWKSQNADKDQRDNAREAFTFLEKKDGQWEPSIVNRMRGRPRYTFDKCNPIVDQISGEIDQADFDIRVRPAGGEASKDVAMVYDGLIRNIEAMSNAVQIYGQAARNMVAGGCAGWLVTQDWAQNDSFDQDLLIRPLNNFEDRVYFDAGSELQDMSDASWVVVLTSMSASEYKKRWPKGSCSSVSDSRSNTNYYHRKESVQIGQIWYKKKVKKELVKFTDPKQGERVYEAGEELDKVIDELSEQGVKEVGRRVRETYEVVTRLFDGADWLNDEQGTAFDMLPVVPAYANFAVRDEGKVVYRGVVEKLIDAQRVLNYTKSRQVEDYALSPKQKLLMTRKQASGEENQLRRLNTSSDPILFFNPDEKAAPPSSIGGAIANPGAQLVSDNATQDLAESAGLFGLNQGNNEGSTLSGVAIQSLQNKGDNATIKYFTAMEVAICATGRILLGAIPKVYSSKRQVRILNEDSSFEIKTVNDDVYDEKSQQMVTLNDLTKGQYDVTCDVGPAFKNRQQETVKALQELSAVIPGVAELTADIQMSNINSPGIDLGVERIRKLLVQQGSIPESQLTDEERMEIQQAQMLAAQQPQQPDAATVLAEAEVGRVKAETADTISKAQERANKAELESQKLQLEFAKLQARVAESQEKADIDEMKLMMQSQVQQAQLQQQQLQAFQEGQTNMVNMLNQQAETMKTLREAMGADAVISSSGAEAYQEQTDLVLQSQDRIEG